MTPRHVLAAAVFVLASMGTASADYPSKIYVATNKQVFAVEHQGAGSYSVNSTPLFTIPNPQNPTILNLTKGADGELYASASNGIFRVFGGGSFSPSDVRDLRFSAYGRLYCATATGVKRSSSVPPAACTTNVTATNLNVNGLAFTSNGSLLIVVGGNTVRKVRLDKDGNQVGAVQTIVPSSAGLTNATGIAVARGGAGSKLGFKTDDFVVAAGATLWKFTGQADGTYLGSTLMTVDGGRTINFVDIDAEDRVIFTTMKSSSDTNAINGELWIVEDTSSPVVITGPLVGTKYPPLRGISYERNARTRTLTAAQLKADYGSSVLEAFGPVNSGCSAEATARLTSASAVPVLPDLAKYRWLRHLGDEGYFTIYHLNNVAPCTQFFSGSPGSENGFVLVFASTEVTTNWALMRCGDADPPAGSCAEPTQFFIGNTGPFVDDPGGGGKTDGWSRYGLVNKSQAAAGSQIVVCNVGSPLNEEGTAQAKTGSSVPVKVRFASSTAACQSNDYFTDASARFLLSLTRLDDPTTPGSEFEVIWIALPSGNSAPEPPLLRFTFGADGYWIYDLKLKRPDGTNLPTGRYEITFADVSDVTLLNAPTSRYFFVVP